MHWFDDVFLKDTTTRRNVFADWSGPFVTVRSASEQWLGAPAGAPTPHILIETGLTKAAYGRTRPAWPDKYGSLSPVSVYLSVRSPISSSIVSGVGSLPARSAQGSGRRVRARIGDAREQEGENRTGREQRSGRPGEQVGPALLAPVAARGDERPDLVEPLLPGLLGRRLLGSRGLPVAATRVRR